MSRYIDADAVISFVDVGHLRNPMELSWSDKDVVDMIESRPTVDAVPVVRCQKCKYYCGEETYTNHRICKIWREETFANGWCYMGERRENGTAD